jgi:UDP-N-acetylmuramoyl-tripeptide--D-alanyl-D-alanine ligase
MQSENGLVNMWVGKNLPSEHTHIKERPGNTSELLVLYFKRWVAHPIKRKIAKYYLAVLRKYFGLKVIGITGSAGKTTAKEMLKSMLSLKGKTVASFENIDPVYNIPQTILKCRFDTKYLVLEMGIEYPGEMDFYMWLARPDISVITNIFPTHTEFFGDKEGVFKEKVKIIKTLDKNSAAVLNADDPLLQKAEEITEAKVLFFGSGSDYKASNIKITQKGTLFTLHTKKSKYDIHIPIIGRQFVANTLSAIVVTEMLGVGKGAIQKGLSSFDVPPNRMKILHSKSGAVLIDDSYNNNPEAAIEALKTFDEVAEDKKKIVIFGDMLELGDLEVKYHKKLGKILAEQNLSVLVGVGKASSDTVETAKKKMGKDKCFWVKDRSGVLKVLKGKMDKDTAVLIKGSRGIKLDEILDEIIKL